MHSLRSNLKYRTIPIQESPVFFSWWRTDNGWEEKALKLEVEDCILEAKQQAGQLLHMALSTNWFI